MLSLNSAQLQAQVRQNSQELASYLHDLHQWEKDVKHKEKDLRAGKLTLTKQQSTSSSSPSLASPPVRSAQPSVTLRDPTADDAARFAQLKAEGNELFGKGQHSAAIECYNTCAILQPNNPLPLSNRAQCHLKLRDFHLAEQDCDAALTIDPAHVKSLFRRATARKELKRAPGAVDDLQRLLQLDPINKPAQQLLKELQQSGSGGQAESKESMIEVKAAPAPSRAIAEAPAVERRKKLLIEEDEEDGSEEEEAVVINRSKPKQKVPLAASSPSTTPLNQWSPVKKTAAATAKPQLPTQRREKASMDTSTIGHAPSPTTPARAPPATAASSIPPTSSSSTLAASPTVASPASASSFASPSPRSVSTPSSSSSGLRPPRSAMDFDSQYRAVRSDPARLSELMSLIPTAEYPTILRTALDASLFTNLVQAIERHLLPAMDARGVWHLLASLPAVPRFPLIVSFLGPQERLQLARAFRLLLTLPPEGVDEATIRATASKYRITEI